MKKIFYPMLVLLPLTFASCGNKSGENTDGEVIPPGMIALDLSAHGMPAVINVPDTVSGDATKTKKQLSIEEINGGVIVGVGTDFRIAITNDSTTLKEYFDTYKVQHFDGIATHEASVNTDTLLLHKFSLPDSKTEFHFCRRLMIGKEAYHITDNNDGVDVQFNEAQITNMANAARSLRAARKKEEAPKS